MTLKELRQIIEATESLPEDTEVLFRDQNQTKKLDVDYSKTDYDKDDDGDFTEIYVTLCGEIVEG